MTTTRRSTSVRRALILGATAAGVPLLAALVAACGSTASPPPKPVSAPSTLPSGSGNPPGVVGMIAAVTGTSIEVQNPTSGQVTVDYSASTRITAQRSGTLSDVKAGACLVATGTPAGGGVTARTVTLTTATNGTCGGRANPFGGGGGPGARPSGRPNRSPRPSASPRDNATAFGTVTAVGGGTITINGTMRSFGNGASAAPAMHAITITVDPATRYTTDAAATASALVTGQCAAAAGTSNDIGTVTAASISVFPPTNNTCGGFNGRGGTGQAAGGGTNG